MTETIAVFGYGSLVTQATLPAGTRSIAGRLSGVRRAWRIAGETPIGRTCGLTVQPCPRTTLRGVVVLYPVSELPELDKREWRYDRHAFDPSEFEPESGEKLGNDISTIVYRVKPEHERWGDAEHPIIQSYVDCVLRGYFERWGSAGVRHFVETTDGWSAPIHNDRDNPRYRRAVRITAEEEALFDTALKDAGASWL
ncbi:MAG: gamma-glutamylcyclotransferase [Hyphomicrobiales bacterium]|nr:MAG: gamma-glutamylcyclotransferase [Hyphomicrobiales bacterium]